MTIPVDFGQVTIRMSGSGLPTDAAVVIGIENLLSQTATAVATVVGDTWENEIMPLLTDDVALVEAFAKLGPDDTGPSASVAYAVTGTIVAESAPPNVAYLVKKATQLGGRRGRGRMYVPGVDETKILSDGRLDATKLGLLQTAFDAFLQDIDTGSCPMVLLHGPPTEWQLIDGQPRRVPIAGAIPDPTPVTELEVQSEAATQRRRLRR